jgi:hypothetical protein
MIRNTSKFKRPDWLFGGNPKAIEEQEAQGQKELVETSEGDIAQLPARGNSCDAKEIYETLGFEVLKETEGDNLFLQVKMKSGWKVEATDHSMWTKLVDPKGNERTSIFYKAAFYDRDSFINPLVTRYYITSDYKENASETKDFTQFIRVKDRITGDILFEREGGAIDTYKIDRKTREKTCRKYLKKNFPKWEDPLAYW